MCTFWHILFFFTNSMKFFLYYLVLLQKSLKFATEKNCYLL